MGRSSRKDEKRIERASQDENGEDRRAQTSEKTTAMATATTTMTSKKKQSREGSDKQMLKDRNGVDNAHGGKVMKIHERKKATPSEAELSKYNIVLEPVDSAAGRNR